MKPAGVLAAMATRRPWIVVCAWIVAAAACVHLLPDLKAANTGALGDLVATDAEAIEIEEQAIERFGFPLLSRTMVVQHRDQGLSPEAEARVYRRAAALGSGELPGLESIPFAIPLTSDVSDEITTAGAIVNGRPTTAITYLFYPTDIGPEGRTGLAERFIARYIDRPGDGEVGLTGAVPARAAQVRAITDSLPLVELATILLVTIAVGLHYRALAAPLLNVLAVAIVYMISVHLIGGIGKLVGIGVPEEVEPVIVALLFGIVTDYSIFFLSRFRARIESDGDPHRAARDTTVGLAPTIVAAALSVAAACATLAAAQLDFFRAFGPGMALSVIVALAVVTTFVPACMAILGRRVFWPHREPAEAGPMRSLRTRISAAASRLYEVPFRRPVPIAIAVIVPLLVLTLACTRLQLGNTLITGLPADSPPRQAMSLVKDAFVPGVAAPVMVVVTGDAVARREAELHHVQTALEAREHVAAVFGPREVLGRRRSIGTVAPPSADAVRYLLVFDVNPLGGRAIDAISGLERDLPGILAQAGLAAADAGVAGDSAISQETVAKTTSDLSRVLPLAALAVLAVLAVFLRALVAPLYLVATSLLALGASLGLTVVFFQDVLGYREVSYYVPFAGIVLLVALGSDYNVYLVGRIWAEARDRPFQRALERAATRARRAITLAGLVLAMSFALLAIVPLVPFRELAFLLATGLLIDAFIVRGLLAPALITIVGERSAWPRKNLRDAAPNRGKGG